MNYRRMWLSALIAAAFATPAVAQDELLPQGVLAVAKMAGACGILDSMIDLQKTTKLPGGDEFVVRFWTVEAARLGMSVEDLSQQCNEAVEAYTKLWEAAGK